jgi:transglycosylase-like protein with SLT domain
MIYTEGMAKACGVCAVALLTLVLNGPSAAGAQPLATTEAAGDVRNQICRLIETVAQTNTLPVHFFARLIWQESRFRPDEIGPVTRSGARAQGIAQFMPATAAERQLFEPFNPTEALPKSGEFLAELRAEFGNLGLAAAAYNAGPQRVRDFLAGTHGLPDETRNYVRAITGRPVEEWAAQAHQEPKTGQGAELSTLQSPISCDDLMASLERTPKRFAAEWQGRTFPSWCKGLRHPNVEECGPVHLTESAISTTHVSLPRSHVHLARSSLR